MPTLREAQHRVMAALFDPAAGDALALLKPTMPLDAGRRLQIYRNNLTESLGAALRAVYPVVERLVGEAFFRQLARRYLRAHPSRAGSLHAFGAALPQFLHGDDTVAALPYLADVAALEWALHESYHDAELPPLAPARLAEVPADRQAGLRLAVQPSARFVASPYPILAIWQANQPDAPEPEWPISLDDGGVRLVVVQRDLELEFRRLGAGEDALLRTFGRGAPLAAAVEAAFTAEAGFDLGAALSRHLALGFFVGLDAGAD